MLQQVSNKWQDFRRKATLFSAARKAGVSDMVLFSEVVDRCPAAVDRLLNSSIINKHTLRFMSEVQPEVEAHYSELITLAQELNTLKPAVESYIHR